MILGSEILSRTLLSWVPESKTIYIFVRSVYIYIFFSLRKTSNNIKIYKLKNEILFNLLPSYNLS